MNYFEQLISLGRFSPKKEADAPGLEEKRNSRPLRPDAAALPERKPGDFSVKMPAGDIQVSIREPEVLRLPRERGHAQRSGRALAEEISDEVMFDALRGRI